MNALMQWIEGPYGTTLSRALLHFLWEGLALALAAAVILKLLDRGSPRARYGVACAFLLSMLAAPVATFLLLLPDPASPQSIALLSGARPVAAVWQPFDTATPSWLPAVMAIWLAGVAACTMRAAGGWCLAAWRLTAGRSVAPEFVVSQISDLSRRLRIGARLRVYASARVATPAVFGALRPVLVLPVSVITGLPPAQLEAILAHELAHVARHDFIVNCLQSVVEVLLFYHPAVWWLSRRIRQERELCCDVVAVQVCGDAMAYSRALLRLEETRQEFALAATGGSLKDRIERLVQGPSNRGRDITAPVLTTVLATAAVVAVFSGAPLLGLQPAPQTPYEIWANQDVAYIMTKEERQAWDRLRGDEEREMFIKQFWERRDPTPGTPQNEAKEEHYRRIAYANDRWRSPQSAGWATARGYIYIVSGPPDEIESHPSDHRENWLYADGRLFRFAGEDYDLKEQTTLKRGQSPIMERIVLDQIPEPKRSALRGRLAGFVGQPNSNDLMERIRVATREVDGTLTYLWSLNPQTRNASLVLTEAGAPDPAAGPQFPTSSEKRIRVGADVMTVKRTFATPPEYPPTARIKGVSGVVMVMIVVGTDGRVRHSYATAGPAELKAAAEAAVRQWIYQPTLLDGQPVEVITTVAVPFPPQ